MVGNIGAPGRINYTLIGDTVNVAQRLEELGKTFASAEDDAVILVSGETAALLATEFWLSALGPHQLRGRISKTEVFRLGGYSGSAPLTQAGRTTS